MKIYKSCHVCGNLIPSRPYQDANGRTCKPKCASELARREHPDLEQIPGATTRALNGVKPGPRGIAHRAVDADGLK